MEDNNSKKSGLTEEQVKALMARIVELEGQLKTLKESNATGVEQEAEQSETHQFTSKSGSVCDENAKSVHFDRISNQDEFYEKLENLSDDTEMVTFSSLGNGVFVDLAGCAAINTLEKSTAVAKANDESLDYVDFIFGISSNEDYSSDDFVKIFGKLKNKINVVAIGDKVTRVYRYYNHGETFSFVTHWGSHEEMEEFVENMMYEFVENTMEEIEWDEEGTAIAPEEQPYNPDDEADECECCCGCCGCCQSCDEAETSTSKVGKSDLDGLVKEVREVAKDDERLMLIILRELFGLKL